MRFGLTSSALTHVVVLVLAQLGMPGGCTPTDVTLDLIPVATISEADLQALLEEETPAPEPVRTPPPEPAREPVPEPVVETPPEPEPVVEAPPEPEPEVALVEAPEPEPDPLPDIRPDKRPEAPPRPEVVEITEEPPRPETAPEGVPDIMDVIEEFARDEPIAPDRPEARPSDIEQMATATQLEALKNAIISQIEPCWSPPIGAPYAEDLKVRVRVRLAQDGSVIEAAVVDRDRMAGDQYYRTAAEAAMRAILNDFCSPLDLPAEQWDIWQDIQFTFNPADMAG